MDFSTNALHELEEMFQTLSSNVSEKVKCKGIKHLSAQQLKAKSITKDTLADIIMCMGTVISESRRVLHSAKEKFDEQSSAMLVNQKELIQVQSDLIACQKTKLDAVHDTVQSEIKTFSEVVQKNCTANSVSNITPAKLKKVVRTAFIDEERPKNLIIFGAAEKLYCKEEEMSDEDLVDEIFSVVGEKPDVENCYRIGMKRSDDRGRPIKVTLRNADAVRDVLSGAKALKSILAPDYSFKFSQLYLSPDRTDEERQLRKKLVQEMKEKIKVDASKRYYIKDRKVCIWEH